jgi:hypothetical protein
MKTWRRNQVAVFVRSSVSRAATRVHLSPKGRGPRKSSPSNGKAIAASRRPPYQRRHARQLDDVIFKGVPFGG